jgi:hypothetical protein
MKSHYYFKTLFFALAAFQISCEVEECEQVVPAITFKTFERIDNSRAKVTVSFKDCDGDIGLTKEQTEAPYDYNFFLEYYYLQNGEWKWLDLSSDTAFVPFYFRVPFLDNKSSSSILEGDIEIELVNYYIPGLGDTIKYTAMLKDRALNESNVVESPVIINR